MVKSFCSLIIIYSVFLCVGYSQQGNLRDCVRSTYTNEIGVKELTGKNDGKRVEEYLATTGNKKGAPWCAAFITWTLKQHCLDVPASLPAFSPSWFSSDKVIPKDQAKYGDVFGIWFNSHKRIAHVGFIDGDDGDFYVTVEGNSDPDSGTSDGGSVNKKRRIKRQIHKIANWID